MERSSALTAEEAIIRVRELSSQISILESAATAASSSSPMKLKSKSQNYLSEENQESSSSTSSSSSSSAFTKSNTVKENCKEKKIFEKVEKVSGSDSSNSNKDRYSTSDHQNNCNVVISNSQFRNSNRHTSESYNVGSDEKQNENNFAVNIDENIPDYSREESNNQEKFSIAPSASSSRRASINVSSSSSSKSNLNNQSNSKQLNRGKKEFITGSNDNDKNNKGDNIIASAVEDDNGDDSDDRLTMPSNDKLFYVNEVRTHETILYCVIR